MTWNQPFLLGWFTTLPNAIRHSIVTLIPRKAVRLIILDWIHSKSSTSSFFSGFTDLQVPVRRRFSRQLQSFCAVHPNLMKILAAAAFSFLNDRAWWRPFSVLISRFEGTWTTTNASIILWNWIQHFIQSQWTHSYELLLPMRSDIYRPFHNISILLS